MTDVPFITDAFLVGAEGAQPATTVVGLMYSGNNSGIIYRHNGSVWFRVMPRAAAGFDPSLGGVDGGFGWDSTQRRLRSYDGFLNGSIQRAVSIQRSTTDTLSAAVITTTETAFATQLALPANYLIAGKLLRVTITGELTASASPPNVTMRLRFQKTGPVNVNLYANTAAGTAPSRTSNGWAFGWIIQGTAAPGAAVSVECAPAVGIAHWNQTNFINTISMPVTVDTASVQTIQVTLQYSANTAGNTMIIRQFLCEEIN